MLIVGLVGAAVSSREVRASGLDGCPDSIVMTFGEEAAPRACAIAYCETHWNNAAVGLAGELSQFQVHPIWFRQYDPERLHSDEWYAAEVAYEMSDGGRNWRAWSCGRA